MSKFQLSQNIYILRVCALPTPLVSQFKDAKTVHKKLSSMQLKNPVPSVRALRGAVGVSAKLAGLAGSGSAFQGTWITRSGYMHELRAN